MCLDVDNQMLYVLGRYLDHDARTSLFSISPPVHIFLTSHISCDNAFACRETFTATALTQPPGASSPQTLMLMVDHTSSLTIR